MKFITWLLLATAAAAAEPVKLPLDVGTLKTRDGKVFEGAKVTGSDAVGVKIIHAGGVARVEYARLPKNLADRFPRDREAAKEQLAKEAKDEANHDRAVDKAVVEKKPTGGEGDSDTSDTGGMTIESKPVLQGNPEVKIAALNAYINRLEDGITKANNTIMDANAKATKYAATATTTVTRTDGYGGSTTREAVNQSRLNRAEFQRKRAEREQQKVVDAQRLIEDARAQISSLQKQIKE